MTPRSIRRAAERKALKRARKAQQLADSPLAGQPVITEPTDGRGPVLDVEIAAESAPSEARLAANRANSLLSTGPKTSEGKAKSSLNAVKTALTGRTVLLPTDDADRYLRHVQAFFDDFQPVGVRESELAQSLADTAWRLNRITTLEMAIYANGRREFEDRVTDESPEVRPALLDMHTFLAYERQLRNLQTQEARLMRQHLKQHAELKELQRERTERERAEDERAATLYPAARKDRRPFRPDRFGFDFSTEDIEACLEGVQPAKFARKPYFKDPEARAAA